MMKTLSEYQPIGRMGRPVKSRSSRSYLCSDEASFVTGQPTRSDGGVTAV